MFLLSKNRGSVRFWGKGEQVPSVGVRWTPKRTCAPPAGGIYPRSPRSPTSQAFLSALLSWFFCSENIWISFVSFATARRRNGVFPIEKSASRRRGLLFNAFRWLHGRCESIWDRWDPEEYWEKVLCCLIWVSSFLLYSPRFLQLRDQYRNDCRKSRSAMFANKTVLRNELGKEIKNPVF